MRDTLPKGGPRYNESGVVNLDSGDGPGTHWVAYKKRGNRTDYFDSYGNLSPPRELLYYLGRGSNIFYNRGRFQTIGSVNCGHLCLRFLLK
jgi:hypothetical protein